MMLQKAWLTNSVELVNHCANHSTASFYGATHYRSSDAYGGRSNRHRSANCHGCDSNHSAAAKPKQTHRHSGIKHNAWKDLRYRIGHCHQCHHCYSVRKRVNAL